MIATATPAEQREHLFRLLRKFNTAMLVTHGDGRELRVRPMAIAQVDEAGQIWFISSAETAKVHEIETDARVNVVCQKDHAAYLSLAGRASLVHDRVKLDEVWNEMIRVWFPGGKDDPSIVLICVTPESGEFWDNQGTHKIKYLFESAKAWVSGRKPDLEEGEEHAVLKL